MPDLNEHILEVRYKPNPKILDYRGSWAEAISDYMTLSEWRILENRIDIYDKENKDHAFVGFKNSGFVAHDTPTKHYFPDKAVRFFKYLLSLDGFEKSPYVERIGIRSKFCKEYAGRFNELRDKYTSNYLSLTDRAKEIFNSKLRDIGGPLNFTDKYGNFNTMSGPMIDEQMAGFFERSEEFPSVGLYFDIDYWLTPKKEVDGQKIVKLIAQFANSAWDKFDSISKLILGE